ncbi:hypothetical protein [Gemmatimonas sp.]|uniref:hypothetical protein n=1 Tax=Gemmatimonas sp. TaxID=1962908 RepID=UPI003563A789
MRTAKYTVLAVLTCVLGACASTTTIVAQVPPTMPPAGQAGTQGDTLDPNWIPAGFGTLRQDDLALKVSPANGLQVRAIPLDERIIRLLSPDSYRSLRELLTSKNRELLAMMERNRLPSYSIWYVSFFAQEQGETRFSPQEFIINNTGRDFRPLDMLPITPGFGEYRLRQRDVQSALMIFDGQIDVNQPLSALMESTPSVTDWNRVIQRIERERSLVRSRAAAAPKPPR